MFLKVIFFFLQVLGICFGIVKPEITVVLDFFSIKIILACLWFILTNIMFLNENIISVFF